MVDQEMVFWKVLQRGLQQEDFEDGEAVVEFAAAVVSAKAFLHLRSYFTLFTRPCPNLSNAKLKQKKKKKKNNANTRIFAPAFPSVAHKIFDLLHGRIWAGHNIVEFDMDCIKEYYSECGLATPEPVGVIDTLLLLRQTFGHDSNLKLARLAEFSGLGNQQHRSLADVQLSIEVLKSITATLFLESNYPSIYASSLQTEAELSAGIGNQVFEKVEHVLTESSSLGLIGNSHLGKSPVINTSLMSGNCSSTSSTSPALPPHSGTFDLSVLSSALENTLSTECNNADELCTDNSPLPPSSASDESILKESTPSQSRFKGSRPSRLCSKEAIPSHSCSKEPRSSQLSLKELTSNQSSFKESRPSQSNFKGSTPSQSCLKESTPSQLNLEELTPSTSGTQKASDMEDNHLFLVPSQVRTELLEAQRDLTSGRRFVVIYHGDQPLLLHESNTRVRFSLSKAYAFDSKGKPRFSFVIEPSRETCDVIRKCEEVVKNYIGMSRQNLQWRPALTMEESVYGARISIQAEGMGTSATYVTEFYKETSTAGVEKLDLGCVDIEAVKKMLPKGCYVDAGFLIDSYTVGGFSGLRLVAKWLTLR